MRLFIAFALLLVIGLGGAVVMKEHERQSSPAAGSASAGSTEKIATISHGESVDIDAHVGDGLVVVEFYADW